LIDEIKVYRFNKTMLILVVIVGLILVIFDILFLLFFPIFILEFGSLIFTVMIWYHAYSYYKNGIFFTINKNAIIFNPETFFGKKVIEINKIERIERPSISKTIIYYQDSHNKLKKVKIGRFALSIEDQIEMNEYITKLREVKFITLD
jgi:hypothetical protein